MNFKCKCCGECCSNFLPLKQDEIKTMKRLAKKENKHPLIQNWYVRCPFLDNNNKCDIYENRPLICREYTCYNYENGIYNFETFKNTNLDDFKLVDIRKEIFGNIYKNVGEEENGYISRR